MAKSKQVLLKRSNVKGKVPALSAMTHGEMFLNYNDGVLMSKSSSNAVLKWSDDSKMATKNELNLKLDKIEAEGSYVKNADFQYLVSEIEDNERVITTAFEKFRESAGFNENGESTLGKSLTEAISELDGVKALANKVTVNGDTVKITTLSANTFSANTAKVGSLSANTFSANTVKVATVSANTISANTIKSNLIGISDSAKTSYSAITSTSAKTSVSATTSFSAATAKSADSAKKLSTGSVGNNYTPVYINNGVPQTISEIDYKKVIRREVSNDASIVNIPIIDAALSPLHSANRLQFAKPSGIIVEYSIDGGSTWVDYGLSDVDKVKFVSGEEINIFAGKGQSSKATSNDKLRITINASDAGFYTAAKSLLINFSTNGSTNCKVDVETSKRGSDTVFTVWKTGLGVSGWSGWNSLPLNFSLGGGVTQTTNTGSLRLTFYSDGAGNFSTDSEHFKVLSLMLFGDTTWRTPSTMAKNGHLYDYDVNQNMILPSGVSVNGTISAKTHNTIDIGTSATTFKNVYASKFVGTDVVTKTVSANTLSAATIKTTNLSATTVSAHTIKSLTMSANTISGNTIRATAMSANTLSANTVKFASISTNTLSANTIRTTNLSANTVSAHTIKSSIVSATSVYGENVTYKYVLQVPNEALDTEISTFILSEDEYEKIKNANDVILRFDYGDGVLTDVLSSYISKSDGNIFCLYALAISNGDDAVETTTFMCSIYEEDGQKVCALQIVDSSVGGDLIYIDANASTVKTDEDGRSYIDFDYDIYNKLLNCKGGSLNYVGLGIFKFEVSSINDIDGERYVTAYFTTSIFDDGFTIPIGGSVYNAKSLSHQEFVLTVYTSNLSRAYLEWNSTAPIGRYANLSNSAVTSYSAITATSAKTSYSAITSTSAKTSYSATTVPASGVKGVLSSNNMPYNISREIEYTAKQHFKGDIHLCGYDDTFGGAIYFGDYDAYHIGDNDPLVYIREKDDDILDIIGNGGVRIGNLVSNDDYYGSDGSESSRYENYAIVVDENGSVTINDLIGYATSDEVDENNEILTKALNRLNTSAGFNSLGESTLPSGMTLTKAILELQKGGGVADKVNVTESSSKSYIVSRETTDSDETSLHYDSAIWSENGQLYASSDKNLKEHVGNVDGNPELIKRIPKVFYHWKDDEQKRIQMGTYAQDIEKVYPEVVSRDDNGNLAVGYDRLSVIALAGIDELYKMIQDLKEENKQLRKELDSLKK